MSQTDFYGKFVEKMLDGDGKSNLTPEDKKYYTNEMASLLEERVGLELLPKLNEKQMAVFITMVDTKETTPEQWSEFWYKAVPTFEVDVARILLSFAGKFKKTA